MTSKILSLCLFVGLFLPLTQGSDLPFDESRSLHQASVSKEFRDQYEKMKAAVAGITEQSLLALCGRHDTLINRTKELDHLIYLFQAHLNKLATPSEGYDAIREDLEEHPNLETRATQLLELEQLIDFVLSSDPSSETFIFVKSQLDKRREDVLLVRRSVIAQRTRDSLALRCITLDLLAQTKTAFELTLEKLRRYRDEETVSKWTLESPLPTEASTASDAETPLPVLASIVENYIELTKNINTEEVEYLQETINRLSENLKKLETFVKSAETLEATPLRDEMIASLKADIAVAKGSIERDQGRLTRLTPMAD